MYETTGRPTSRKRDKGRHYLGLACYTLSKEDKQSMFDCLNGIKVPSGYSSNIKRLLNLKEKKFAHVKSYDCHVLMTQLIPVALRGILPANVRATIIKSCAFLNTISQKAIDPLSLSRLCEDVVQNFLSYPAHNNLLHPSQNKCNSKTSHANQCIV